MGHLSYGKEKCPKYETSLVGGGGGLGITIFLNTVMTLYQTSFVLYTCNKENGPLTHLKNHMLYTELSYLTCIVLYACLQQQLISLICPLKVKLNMLQSISADQRF